MRKPLDIYDRYGYIFTKIETRIGVPFFLLGAPHFFAPVRCLPLQGPLTHHLEQRHRRRRSRIQ